MYFLVHWPFIDITTQTCYDYTLQNLFKTVNAKGILDFLKVAALYFAVVNA